MYHHIGFENTHSACLDLVRKRQQVYYEAIYRNSSIKGYWLIQNSEKVSDLVSEANSKGGVTSIKTYDFSTLYTNLPHTELKRLATAVCSILK